MSLFQKNNFFLDFSTKIDIVMVHIGAKRIDG